VQIVEAVAALASVVAIPLTIYFYVKTQVFPQLTYYVHPVRATVVKSGAASSLSVNFNDKAVTGDITAAQIAIWNAGRMPIKRADVLKPLLITLPVAAPILEGSVRKVSRDVTNVTLNDTSSARNQIGVQFDILERNDGCVIQLIYAGSPDLPITVSAVIIGQHGPQELRYGASLLSPADQYITTQRKNRAVGWFAICAGCFFALVIPLIWHYRLAARPATWIDRCVFVMPVMLIALGIFQLWISGAPEPPFGFQ
jgi:hypothetical protein